LGIVGDGVYEFITWVQMYVFPSTNAYVRMKMHTYAGKKHRTPRDRLKENTSVDPPPSPPQLGLTGLWLGRQQWGGNRGG